MTQEEYEKISKMINDAQTLECRSINDYRWVINSRGVECLLKEIKTLVKEWFSGLRFRFREYRSSDIKFYRS